MRVRRRGRVVTLFLPACIALALGNCAHLPGWVPFARTEADPVRSEATGAAARDDAAPVAPVAAGITGEAVTDRVDSLASYGPLAYLAAELDALGLEPAGDSGGFVQRLPIDRAAAPVVTAGEAASRDNSDRPVAPASVQPAAGIGPAPVSLRASGAQGVASPVFGRDFFVQSMSVSSVSAPLVWAGVAAPGRRAPGPEAAGRVLAFYMPGDTLDKTWRAALSNAVRGSVSAGAAAVLLVLDPELDDETITALASRANRDAAQAPVVGLRYAAAQRIFRNGLSNLDQLRNGPNQLVPVTGTTVTLDAAAGGGIADERLSNIVGILPGSDPVLKDTYVVFSAPIATASEPQGPTSRSANGGRQPAGRGGVSPSISTAALLEVAGAFAALQVRPARSLIFLGAGGNGAGRLGSQYFGANPPVPAERIVASISIDSIVENATDTIAVIGQHYTSMGPLVQQVARTHPELNLAVAPDLSPEDDRFLRGDSFSFARVGVPAISFAAAPPHDTFDASADMIAPDGAIEADEAGRTARIARFIFYFGHTVASRAERPIWTAEGRAAVQKNE